MNLPSVTLTHFYEPNNHDNSDLDRKDSPFGQTFASRAKQIDEPLVVDASSSSDSESSSSGFDSGDDSDEESADGKIPDNLKKKTSVTFCMQRAAEDSHLEKWVKQIHQQIYIEYASWRQESK